VVVEAADVEGKSGRWRPDSGGGLAGGEGEVSQERRRPAGLNPQWEVAGGEGKKKVIAAVARQWVVGGQVGRRRWSGL